MGPAAVPVAALLLVGAATSTAVATAAPAADAAQRPDFPVVPAGVRAVEMMRHVGTQNCTWRNISQPIDHFGTPKGTYQERYCIYDQFYDKSKPDAPMFFYVGNESPVTLYINASGLMWEHGKEMGAVLVWAEHRFEGTSYPDLAGVPDCAVAGTSAQALADYIALIKVLKGEYGGAEMPVIAFGGSYGGMLAGWIRIRYPEIITGAIAASAPVITKNTTTKDVLQGGFYAISRGMKDKQGGVGVAGKHCFSNYRAAQVLLPILAENEQAMAEMVKGVRMCPGHAAPETINPGTILSKVHAPMFGFGEANYPFPQCKFGGHDNPNCYVFGDYPPYPMAVACSYGLDADLGIVTTGDTDNVKFTLKWGALEVHVDWNETSGFDTGRLTKEQIGDMRIMELTRALLDFGDSAYIRTGSPTCQNTSSSPTTRDEVKPELNSKAGEELEDNPPISTPPTVPSDGEHGNGTAWNATGVLWQDSCPPCEACPPCPVASRARPPQDCKWTHPEEAWGLVSCMDNFLLGGTAMKGNGRDVFWPPSAASRSWTLEDIIGPDAEQPASCGSPPNIYGGPTKKWSHDDWLASYYDEANQLQHANIVWSNGMLDPWSGGGHYGAAGRDGPLVQAVSGKNSVVLNIPQCGHHADLMFSTPYDPPGLTQARKIELAHIQTWVREHNALVANRRNATSRVRA